MIRVKRLNHIVLFVNDLDGMVDFYERILGLQVAERLEGAAFLAVPGSVNHHDLGLIQLSDAPTKPTGPQLGLYHMAWEVEKVQELQAARTALQDAGVLAGESEHGTSLSLYAHDPEGNEFEIFWPVPGDRWHERGFGIRPLDLDAEVRFFS